MPHAKYEKKAHWNTSFFVFFHNIGPTLAQILPQRQHKRHWNMLGDTININTLCCNPEVLKKKSVKPLKNCFFLTQFARKGGHYGQRPRWKNFFWKKSKIHHQLSESFYFIEISYVLTELWIFFCLEWCFLSNKCYFQWKQLCARHKPIIWCYKRSFPAQKYTLPGINSYEKILEKSDLYTYLFLITENTMIWI